LLTIGWFSTGRDEAARQLLQVVYERIQSGEIEGEIAYVFSNREAGESIDSDLFFALVHNYRIPLVCLSSKRFEATEDVAATAKTEPLPGWRVEYDREIMRKLQRFSADLCVLAGYMLIVGEEMCHKYDMINLHPAAPDGPKGSWQEVIWTLIENNAKESGVMMHLVTPELDRGPVITYSTFPITGEPFDKHWQEMSRHPIAELKKEQGENNALFRLIRQHGLDREFPLIVSTLRAFSKGEISIEAGKIFDSQRKPIAEYDLSNEVNELVGME
jgi:phosphoribosylglycinamide formyltransferase-1